MQIFANGKWRFHSLMEFFVIHSKKQEVKIKLIYSTTTMYDLPFYSMQNAMCPVINFIDSIQCSHEILSVNCLGAQTQ